MEIPLYRTFFIQSNTTTFNTCCIWSLSVLVVALGMQNRIIIMTITNNILVVR